MRTINAKGLACPLPVINTKNELAVMSEGEMVEVLVDNEIAVQNLSKFASVRGYAHQAETISANEFKVTITKGAEAAKTEEEEILCEVSPKGNTVVVISSNCMGSSTEEGSEKLGKTLMKAFIFALTKQDTLPETILLYNGGAFLSCEGSDSLEDLKLLEAEGVQILTCGTCLNFYGLSEKLSVGGVTNMYDIVETMNHAGKILRP